MKKSLQINGFILLCILLPLLAQAQDESQRVTIDDLMSLQSLSSPQISPDGEWVAYVVRSRDMEEDKSNTQVFMVATSGGEPIPMTDKETSASDPQWSPDGKFLSFTASKGEDAKTQIWTLNRLGGEAVQLTNVIPGVGDYAWSPDGSRLLLTLTDHPPT